nr:hemin uptake protein HemP [Aurantimonas sp. VKM B-3413]
MPDPPDPDGSPAALVEESQADERLVLSSDRLFGDRREIEIHHQSTVYRLRLTKAGKLILTK